ncbi:CDP-glycerol glycerophosphotransferase family protein [Brochothrix thermosphacta]|uniref:CDP-glycerol glycerophosphotransferase family protein n=1 Tax=Brochothrix thermosphacta TaxID=2756 RepID=UPI000D78CB64|nr:CDP-glycerol glycerophosphotransferase family protein [Brochothrix thermosphacta]SPN75515.1 Teichoic acid poly(ribitol-phosphate) polymerase [Brochothrix thermosphacta]
MNEKQQNIKSSSLPSEGIDVGVKIERFKLYDSYVYIKGFFLIGEKINSEEYKAKIGFTPIDKSLDGIYIYTDINVKTEGGNFSELAFSEKINLLRLDNGMPLHDTGYELSFELEKVTTTNKTESGKIIAKQDYNSEFESINSEIYYFSAVSNKTFAIKFFYNDISQTINFKTKKIAESNPLSTKLESDVKIDSRVFRVLKRYIFKIMYEIFSMFPVKKNKLVFLSDSRKNLTGNFEYIYEELQKRKHNFKISFHLKSSIKESKSIKETISLAYSIATSKYILLDDFYPLIYPLKIRKNIELIQVWHAVGAFKTFGYSRVGLPGGPKITSKNHRNYTKVLVSSKNIIDKYAEGFGIEPSAIIPMGVPRTDLFFDNAKKQVIINRLHEELPFINGKKVILFAPTFRGDGQQSAYYPFGLINFKKIYEEFKEGYVFLLKIHPFVQNKMKIPNEYSDFYYDVSNYREINDLLLISDQLITDYSSVCFEYALLNRPMIFFNPDLKEYTSDRDFYYDYFEFIPGPFAVDTKMLIEELKNDSIDVERLDNFKNIF